MNKWAQFLLAVWLLAAAGSLAVVAHALWPGAPDPAPPSAPDSERRLLLLAASLGALGASIASLQSLADYAGERKLEQSWLLHYLVRPVVGAGVAVLFYLLLRGGLLAGPPANPYGLAALSALAGMFSDRAILKLREVFLTLFQTDDSRSGKLTPPTPTPSGTPGITSARRTRKSFVR
ncbi:MAG: hypothetical protein ACRD96_29795 [Bryobacteraceae bacterium]